MSDHLGAFWNNFFPVPQHAFPVSQHASAGIPKPSAFFTTSAPADVAASATVKDGGVGYGGDNHGDQQQRAQGRAAAKAKEAQCQTLQRQQLQASHTTITASTPPLTELVDTLKQVLRNGDPNLWSQQEGRNLYVAALQTCQLIAKHHPKYLGTNKDDDDESILCALEELATTSELLVHQHSTQAQNVSFTSKVSKNASKKQPEDVVLAKRVLLVREEVNKAASKAVVEHDDYLSVMDHHQHYRKALRPFAFEFVESFQGQHSYAQKAKSSSTNSARSKALLRELLTYKTALPIEYGSSIFVRAMESRMDLLRVLILGPDDTPYANGCFVLDVHLPPSYPKSPPLVKFLTTGGGKFRLNPNLYNDGKVCLSLLGTWAGPGWQAGESTLLQVLVSIQSLILVNDPYFNEPGFQESRGTPHGTRQSDQYNADIRYYTMAASIVPFLKATTAALTTTTTPATTPTTTKLDYPEFNDVVARHFELKGPALKKQLFQWNQQDKTGKIRKSYQECLEIWQEQLKSQPRGGRKRKRCPWSSTIGNRNNFVAAVAVPAANMNIRPDGVIELDLDDDNDHDDETVNADSNGTKQPQQNVRRPSNLVGSHSRDTADSKKGGVVETIDLHDDDDDIQVSTKPPAKRATRSESGASIQNTANNDAVDLT
jgi:ubiquitin-protein ligase